MVGPNQVVDIKWNDVKKWGDFGVKNGLRSSQRGSFRQVILGTWKGVKSPFDSYCFLARVKLRLDPFIDPFIRDVISSLALIWLAFVK